MKTKIISLLTIGAFMLFSNSIKAQQEFVWDHYKIAMTLPSDFKIITNTDNEFECEGDGMSLYMYVYEDIDVDFNDMVKDTKAIARKLKFEVTDEVHDFKDDDGFDGRYVMGLKDGRQIMLCGLVNTQSAANFWIVIEFADGDKQAEEDGVEIIHSISQHK